MKGLQASLVVVVAAIVILIVALVILTIFGVGITPMRSITDAEAQCDTIGQASCLVTGGTLPPTWDTDAYSVDGELMSCRHVNQCNTCSECVYDT